jgi:phosphoesterase RecJ-like protein
MKNAVEQIKKILSEKKKIVLIGHINPDGDAVGSAFGLSFLWKKMGYTCTVLLPDSIDYTLSWMPGIDESIIYKRTPDQAKISIEEAEVIFCLDCNSLQRIGDMGQFVRNNHKAAKILIDHHLTPNLEDFDIVISTSKVSSTAELTYDFIKEYGQERLIDKDIATALYVGIITDTGSLNYATDNTDVFRKVADLIDIGIDVPYIRARLYNMVPESRLRLAGYALYSKMIVIKSLRSAYIVLDQEELRRLHYQKGDTEGLVNYCIMIKNVIFGTIITEHPDRIQLSFRSRGNFDVSKIASEYFDGGGHKNASGGSSYISLNDTVKKLENIIQNHRAELLAVTI